MPQVTGVGIGVYAQVCSNPPLQQCLVEDDDDSFASYIEPEAGSVSFKNLVGVSVPLDGSGVCFATGLMGSAPGVEFGSQPVK